MRWLGDGCEGWMYHEQTKCHVRLLQLAMDPSSRHMYTSILLWYSNLTLYGLHYSSILIKVRKLVEFGTIAQMTGSDGDVVCSSNPILHKVP